MSENKDEKTVSEESRTTARAEQKAASGTVARRLRAALEKLGISTKTNEALYAYSNVTEVVARRGGESLTVRVETDIKVVNKYATYSKWEFDPSRMTVYFYQNAYSNRCSLRSRKAEPDGFSDERLAEISEAVDRQLARNAAVTAASNAKTVASEQLASSACELKAAVPVVHSVIVRTADSVEVVLRLTRSEFERLALTFPKFMEVLK